MKDTFTLWAHQDKKSGEITWVGNPEHSRQNLRGRKLSSERVVKLECRIVQPKRKPKRGQYPNDNFGLPEGHKPHNPDNLTREQVGEGFRLLADAEIGYHREFSLDLSAWRDGEWDTGGNYGCLLYKTYRVSINTPLDLSPELKTK